MPGTTLRELRKNVESLDDDDGAYYLVCARTGERPVPASEHRFESRATARVAAQVTERYRAVLREYDPNLRYLDPVVVERVEPVERADATNDGSGWWRESIES